MPKVESEKVPAERLTVNKVLTSACDLDLINTLGGEAKLEISLGQFFMSFTEQPNGNCSPLLTNGSAVVGYARDIMNILWGIYGIWYTGRWNGTRRRPSGWCFGACPLDDMTIRRNPGDWVLSR